LETKTLVEIIIFVALFFVALQIGLNLISYFTDQPDSGTTKSLEALKTEINTLEIGEERNVPVFIDKKHIIKGFSKENKLKPTDCRPKLDGEKDKACICICTKETCDTIKKEVGKCQKLDIDLSEEYVLTSNLEKEEAIPQNCILKRDEKISISCL